MAPVASVYIFFVITEAQAQSCGNYIAIGHASIGVTEPLRFVHTWKWTSNCWLSQSLLPSTQNAFALQVVFTQLFIPHLYVLFNYSNILDPNTSTCGLREMGIVSPTFQLVPRELQPIWQLETLECQWNSTIYSDEITIGWDLNYSDLSKRVIEPVGWHTTLQKIYKGYLWNCIHSIMLHIKCWFNAWYISKPYISKIGSDCQGQDGRVQPR